MADDELCFMSATRMVEAFERRELSPAEVAAAQLERIRDLDGKLNAFRLVDEETTLEEARRSELRYGQLRRVGLVDGVPVAIKDSFHTAGWSTLFGSRTVDPDGEWLEEAPTVSSLRRHNGVRIGKTTMPEFGWKAVTDSPLTGVTRNPWDRGLTPGGSSGGNAVALATGMCTLALGSDIGGSVRIPASFCGVVGFKPTQNLAPIREEFKSGLLLHSGVMARTVEDVALAMDVVGEWDPGRPSRPMRSESFSEALREDVEGLRVAVLPELGVPRADREVRDSVLEAARTLELLGAWVSEVKLGLDHVTDLYTALIVPVLALEVEEVEPGRRDLLDPGLRETAEAGRSLTAAHYVKALQQRRGLIAKLGELQEYYDVLLTATVPIRPFEVGREVPEGWDGGHRWWSWTPLTYPFNITGQPAISVPQGFTSDGLPIGVQLVGFRHGEDVVLKAAHAYQRANPLFHVRPPVLGSMATREGRMGPSI